MFRIWIKFPAHRLKIIGKITSREHSKKKIFITFADLPSSSLLMKRAFSFLGGKNMKKKLLAISVCMLMITSTITIIKPENLDVKADSGGGDGNNIEINESFIHYVAQKLSNITFTFSKGRAFGTSGERHASELIMDWMNETGLSNVYLENIKNTSQHPQLNATEDINSEGIYIGNQRLTECYISPLTNYTNDSLAHNYSYQNLDVRRPFLFPWVDQLFGNKSFLNELLVRENNDSIYDYSTFFDFCMERFEEKYNFNISTINVSDPDTYPSWCNRTLPNCTGMSPFLYILVDDNFNPNFSLPPFMNLIAKLNPLGYFALFYYKFRMYVELWWWNFLMPNLFKGLIKYDFNKDTYNMQLIDNAFTSPHQPVLFITGHDGKPLNDSIPDFLHPSNTKVSFWVNETHNDSVISSNVIGQINGTNPNKTVIISCLYDCWWNQGAGDSAIGMGTVLAIAKYMKDLQDHHIKPKYTVKFIAFAGEEQRGMPGAQYYNDTHTNENITTIIDLNQLGFNQTGKFPQTFFVDTDNKSLIPTLKCITSDTNYCDRSGTPFLHFEYSKDGGPSDCGTLVQGNNSRNSILFLKDMNWTMHHRDGVNHTKGDTMDYYNPADVSATADMVWNVTKYFTMNPNCTIDGTVAYTSTDSPYDQDTLKDTIKATIPMKSILPQDLARVKAKLIKKGHTLPSAVINQDFIITNTTKSYIMNITLPPYCSIGNYSTTLDLYNSTERINDSIKKPTNANASSQSEGFYLFPRGNKHPATPSKPYGNTSLSIGKEGKWNSTTSDPNYDLVGEQWYSKYSIIPPYVKFTDTGLYDPVSTPPSVSRRFWAVGTHHIKVKAYDHYSGPLHRYESPYSDVLDVSVGPYANIFNPQEQLHQDQGNVLHLVQGETTLFYGSQTGSSSPQYNWEFDDGSKAASEQNATHTYTNSRTYNLTLNITDTQTQLTGSNTLRVRVTPLDSNFNMSYFHGTTPNTLISFQNISKVISGRHITNCTWDFGDGTVSYQSNVNHTYTEEGDYNVTLTVKDNQGNIDTDYTIIDITSYPFPPEIPEVQSPGIISNTSDATILAIVNPTDRNLSNVKVQITTPNNTTGNYTMTHLGDDIYLFTLNNTSMVGQYNFTVWAKDTENNINSSSGSYYLMLPVLTYAPPTPDDGANVNHSWVKVNVSVNDTCNTSAFIDWNRTLHGYWSMDVYNNTCIFDNSTYMNEGLFHNGMNSSSITTGKYGKGLEFDGVDDYVDLGNDTGLNLGTGDFTFMVWEKSHASSYANTTPILGNQPENVNVNGYVCGVKNAAFFYTVQNGQTTLINGTHDVTDDTWHHLAFVRKGNNLSLYVDRSFDTGRTGTIRNVTNNKDTCFSYENRTDWYHFDGMLDEAQLYNRALGRDEINASYNNGLYRLCHDFTGLTDGTYQYSAHAIDVNGNQGAAEIRQVTIDTVAPTIVNVGASPTVTGFGGNVSINTNVTDDRSGVNNVNVTITHQSGGGITIEIDPMSHLSGTLYRYVFSDTWYPGQYNYTIIAYDNAGNKKTSTVQSFNVSVSASMSIATLKDSYTGNQCINITDPPDPPQNLTIVGRGLTWNTFYNASSGTNILESYQEPVNYREDNGSWTPINVSLSMLPSNHPAYTYGYQIGNNHGLFGVYFKPNIQSDWPVVFTYNRSTDLTTSVVRSKLLGVGYLDPASNWAYHYLQTVQSSQGQANGNSVTYAGAFTGTNVTWNYGNTELKEAITMSNATRTVLQNHPPSSYGLHDASSYLVFITKLDYQTLNLYNSSGLLNGNVTISDIGVDLKNALGQFKCGLPLGDAYEANNESVRQKLTYRIVHLNGDTYLLSGIKITDLSMMVFPVVIDPTLSVYSTSSDGYIYNSGNNYGLVHDAANGTVDDTAAYITIGQKKVSTFPPSYTVYRGFVFFNTSALPMNAYLDSAILSLYKRDDYSATEFNITIQTGEPTGQQSGQPTYPHDPLQTGDYNQSHYLGNGGSLNTTNFVNGHNNITLTSLNWINKTGTTKLCLRSSRDINGKTSTINEYVNVYSADAQVGPEGCKPKLIITYRNQSKIMNTGSTNMKGYLLMQVQFYNSSQGLWVANYDVVNDTSPRTINSNGVLGLDTLFNGALRASDLFYGNGTYRVYTAFRDPNGNILKTSSGVELKAWWQFSKT